METLLRMSRAKGLTTASYYCGEVPWGSEEVLDRLWPSAIKMQVRIAEATYRVLSRYLANIVQRVCRPYWTWPTLMRQLLVRTTTANSKVQVLIVALSLASLP